jgi:hypothetical protein
MPGGKIDPASSPTVDFQTINSLKLPAFHLTSFGFFRKNNNRHRRSLIHPAFFAKHKFTQNKLAVVSVS